MQVMIKKTIICDICKETQEYEVPNGIEEPVDYLPNGYFLPNGTWICDACGSCPECGTSLEKEPERRAHRAENGKIISARCCSDCADPCHNCPAPLSECMYGCEHNHS